MNDDDPPIIVPPLTTGSPMPPPPPSPESRRRRGPIVVAIVVVGALVGAAVAVVVTRGPSSSPEAPGDVRATATTCAPPTCARIASSITITWSAPSSGSPVTGYAVLRDGHALQATIGAGATRYVDAAVNLGQVYTYQVVAHSGRGDSPVSARATARSPLPPLADAQLAGTYSVRLTVQTATNLQEVEGIKNPSPEDHRFETWGFEAGCAADRGACSTTFNGNKPALRWNGRTYRGTVRFATATCGAGGSSVKVPVHVTLSLRTTKASELGSSWRVASFVGTYGVSFSCPGGVASVARFTLHGSLTG